MVNSSWGINSSGEYFVFEFGKVNILMRSDCDKNITFLDPRIILEKNAETGKWKASVPQRNISCEADTSYLAAISVSDEFNKTFIVKEPKKKSISKLPFVTKP